MFRILSPTAILGYGFPEASFQTAMESHIDLIAVDAGSVDAGPYYLGSDKHYVSTASLKRDLRFMIRAAIQHNCPCVIGSAGFSGANPQLDDVVHMIQDIITEEQINEISIAQIDATVSTELALAHQDNLQALGRMPALSADIISNSKMVGQMGIEPITTAFQAGAQIIICGRAYDPAVFAAIPIFKGYDPGICFHAGKILECGAIACTPGSGSDCLIAEIYPDAHAEFYPCNPQRRCSIKSIAAHSLYEKSRPDFFHLPGGCLNIQQTEFFQVNEQRAGIRGSIFISEANSIKIEGSQCVGNRHISIVPLQAQHELDSDQYRIYGNNGVEGSAVETEHNQEELGIILHVSGEQKQDAQNVLALLRSTLLHYGYAGRISTAGNIAFPCSPSDITYSNNKLQHCFCIGGTRDPLFHLEWPQIQPAIIQHVQTLLPEESARCDINIYSANKQTPYCFIETVDDEKAHQQALHTAQQFQNNNALCISHVDVGPIYEWSVHHLITDPDALNQLFPIQLWCLDEQQWHKGQSIACDWGHSIKNNNRPADATQSCNPSNSKQEFKHRLIDIAEVIRSKNAGINEITYDIIFKEKHFYQDALENGQFTSDHMAELFNIPSRDVIGCFHYPVVNAIKITLHRQQLAGSIGDRDVFGAQQHRRLLDVLC